MKSESESNTSKLEAYELLGSGRPAAAYVALPEWPMVPRQEFLNPTVLDPGSRKTKTGYFWVLARDDRAWNGSVPPGVAFTFAPGRGGIHAERILQGFSGSLQVDGYAGYNRLIAPDRIGPDIRLAYCWAHARRKLVEITRNGSAPVAEDGVKRIGELYRIEAELRGLDPQARLA